MLVFKERGKPKTVGSIGAGSLSRWVFIPVQISPSRTSTENVRGKGRTRITFGLTNYHVLSFLLL